MIILPLLSGNLKNILKKHYSKLMKEICPKDKCTGCAACFNSCGKNAITIEEDACGYIHPQIDQSKCIDCGLCAKVCPVNIKVTLRYPLDCYAATVKNEEELANCASGGMATELSRYVINNGGVVYGCTGKDIRNVHHIRIDKMEELNLLKGSKYVQSYIGETYKDVKRDLQSDRLVLFIGTPCQVAGLYGVLRQKDHSNLITIDLVCHGVPSQKMLNDDIALYCHDNEDISVWFRKKVQKSYKNNATWNITYGLFIKPAIQENTMYKIKKYKDPYMLGFLAPLTFRSSCYICRYANISRCSDFTLGDFWGLGKEAGFVNGKGVSVVLVNTDKAAKVWTEISTHCICVQRDIVEAQKGNGQLQVPSKKHRNYNKFISLYPNTSFKHSVKSCLYLDRIKLHLFELRKFIK